MEIIKPVKNVSNFEQARSYTKDKKILNGFNKLAEPISNKNIYCENVLFEKPVNADIYLCYPLSVVVYDKITISSLHELIKKIKHIYANIYKKPGLYGIWGHDIYDLVIESITVYQGDKNSIISVGIGS